MRLIESHELFRSTEIGDLPENWDVLPLGDLFDVQQGKALSPSARMGASPRPFLRTANILWGRLDLERLDQMNFSSEEAERLSLRSGDLLVCEGGEIGRTALWRSEVGGCSYQNHVHRLRAKRPDVVPEFVMYWMQAAFVRLGLYGGVGNRTTIPNLSGARLKQLPLPLPSVSEQRAIIHILSRLQASVEMREKVVATLEELKAATMAKLFREGLRSEPTELRQTPFGEVPAHWSTAPLAIHAEVQTGVAKGRELEGDLVEVPYLRVANVQDGYLDLEEIKTIAIREAELKRFSLQVGDVLLTEGGDFDKLGRGYLWSGEIPNCVHQNHIFAVRVDRRTLLPEFLAYLAQSPYGKAYFLSVAHKTTNLACINATKLKAFPLLLPDLAEQEQIAQALRRIDRALDVKTHRLRDLRVVFSTMLGLLMTGQVRVARPEAARREGFSEETLREIVRRIVETAQPEKIILFGSTARGEMGPDSDVDLLVVKSGVHRRELAARLYRELADLPVPKDIIVTTPEDLEQHRDTIGLVYRTALREGRVIYAAT